ncbi:hypothetical protein [Streptomyces sp. NPDC060194]|uniref:hypothetical protein n=1 Tax=Streptomyces sp. NPDC060194 TaxID=3347069 RepID=UPI00364F6938
MADAEFTARGVRIGRRLRSLTRAGQVRISDGRLELLTSYGSEIDSAPVSQVTLGRPWFAAEDEAAATVNGRRYLLKLGGDARTPGGDGPGAAGGFLAAFREAGARGTDRTGGA